MFMFPFFNYAQQETKRMKKMLNFNRELFMFQLPIMHGKKQTEFPLAQRTLLKLSNRISSVEKNRLEQMLIFLQLVFMRKNLSSGLL